MFFDVYRLHVFGTLSYDDYARFLLFVLGERGGQVPPSPFVYRIGSVVLAIPFYYLPPLELRGGWATDPTAAVEYVRATQAICAANVFFVTATAIVIMIYLRGRLRTSLETAFCAALVFIILSRYLGLGSIDGIATLVVAAGVISAAERYFRGFCAAALIGAAVNEKILLVLFAMVSFRALSQYEHRLAYMKLAAAAAAVLFGYVLTVWAFPFPGAENQRDVGTYIPSLVAMLKNSLTAQGLYQNLWPPIILAALWLVGMSAPTKGRFTSAADIAVPLVLLLVSLALNVNYNAGRITMYALPLFVIGAAQSLALMSAQMAGSNAYNRRPELSGRGPDTELVARPPVGGPAARNEPSN